MDPPGSLRGPQWVPGGGPQEVPGGVRVRSQGLAAVLLAPAEEKEEAEVNKAEKEKQQG